MSSGLPYGSVLFRAATGDNELLVLRGWQNQASALVTIRLVGQPIDDDRGSCIDRVKHQWNRVALGVHFSAGVEQAPVAQLEQVWIQGQIEVSRRDPVGIAGIQVAFESIVALPLGCFVQS